MIINKQNIKSFIVDSLDLQISPNDIADEMLLDTDLGIGSVHLLELATSIEEEFGVYIDDEEIYKIFKSVNSIFDFLSNTVQMEE